jgi:hypothetical protein
LNPDDANASNHSAGAIAPPLFPSKEIDMHDSKTKTSLAALGLVIGMAPFASPAAAQTQTQTPYQTSQPPQSYSSSSQSVRQVQARVTSVNQITESNGSTAYNVTYEYDGRSYSMRTPTYPGPTVPIEVNAYGVATMPVGGTGSNAASTGTADDRSPWDRVVPERGVVVSNDAPLAPAAYYSAPVYAPPPVYAAPVYVNPGYGYYGGYGYGYGSPFYSPIGLSLNLGYSRGWGGGYRHGGWRR